MVPLLPTPALKHRMLVKLSSVTTIGVHKLSMQLLPPATCNIMVGCQAVEQNGWTVRWFIAPHDTKKLCWKILLDRLKVFEAPSGQDLDLPGKCNEEVYI